MFCGFRLDFNLNKWILIKFEKYVLISLKYLEKIRCCWWVDGRVESSRIGIGGGGWVARFGGRRVRSFLFFRRVFRRVGSSSGFRVRDRYLV